MFIYSELHKRLQTLVVGYSTKRTDAVEVKHFFTLSSVLLSTLQRSYHLVFVIHLINPFWISKDMVGLCSNSCCLTCGDLVTASAYVIWSCTFLIVGSWATTQILFFFETDTCYNFVHRIIEYFYIDRIFSQASTLNACVLDQFF